VSTAAISPIALLENAYTSLSSSNSTESIQSLQSIRFTNQPSITNASTVNAASKINTPTSGQAEGTLTHDTFTLLSDLSKGNLSAANTDLSKLKTDLNNQTASATSGKINQDVASLLKDLYGGDSSAINADLTTLKSDLQTQDESSANIKSASSQNISPLATLLGKVQDQLNTGNIQGALEDVSGYLVQNGQVTGSLLNVSA
jgi:hypothetical protein